MPSIALRLLPLLALAFAFAPLRAAGDPRLAALQAADDERVAATVAGDQARLGAIFSDELRYAHASGSVDTKAAFLEALATGRTKYLAWEYQARDFTFPAPGIALMAGRTRIQVAKADGAATLLLTFLGVWREEKGRWRFLAWQSGKLPEPAAAPK